MGTNRAIGVVFNFRVSCVTRPLVLFPLLTYIQLISRPSNILLESNGFLIMESGARSGAGKSDIGIKDKIDVR